MRLLIILMIYMTNLQYSYATPIKTIEIKENQIITLNTKLGYSTKIIFESKPKPGLVGDQDAFAVEYLGKIVSIKPLIPGSQTNLFIPSKEGNYNFILKATNKSPDNVVYIKRKLNKHTIKQDTPYPPLQSRLINKKNICEDMSLHINRLSWPDSHSSWILDFNLHIKKSKNVVFYLRENEKYNFMLFQTGKALTLEGVFQDRFLLDGKNYSTQGKIHIRQENINPYKKIRIIYGPRVITQKNKKCLPLEVTIPPMNKLTPRRF